MLVTQMKIDAIWASRGWWGQGTCPTCPEAAGRGQRCGDPWATRTSLPGAQDAEGQERMEREKSLDQTEGVRPPPPGQFKWQGAWPLGLRVRPWHWSSVSRPGIYRASGWALRASGVGRCLPVLSGPGSTVGTGACVPDGGTGPTQGGRRVQLPQFLSSRSLLGLNQRTEIQHDQGPSWDPSFSTGPGWDPPAPG